MIERLAIVLLLAVIAAAICLSIRALARRRAGQAVGQHLAPHLLPEPAPEGMSLLYFFGSHCAQCRQQAAVLDTLEAETGTSVVRMDAAHYSELTQSLGIMTVPATAVLDRGQVRAVNLGPRSLEDLQAQLAG